ncbi:unnamed protein product [Rhodiola kirilowii]
MGVPHHQTPTRCPDGENLAPHRRPKSREVTSRYLSGAANASSAAATASSTPARRLPSPIRPRTPSMAVTMTPMPMPTSAAIKRSQSVERRRAATPMSGEGVGSAAAKMLFTSTRSLSVSFQGESFSLKVSKAKPAPTPAPAPVSVVRRGTPERRKMTPARGDRVDRVDNSKTIEQHRWPARLRPDNFMTRSVDCTDDRKKLGGSGSSVVRVLQKSMVAVSTKAGVDGKRFPNIGSMVTDANLRAGSVVPSGSVSSESVSSGSTSGGGGRRNLMIPAKFWQENNTSNLKHGRPSEHVSPMAKSTTSNAGPPPNYFTPKRLSTDSPVSSSPKSMSGARSFSSPQRGAGRPASPSKLATSYTSTPSRGMPSPARVRTGATGATNSNFSNMSSILCFAADARRGRIGENKIDGAHFLRLLYNRLMQWRFVNARANAASTFQILIAEKSLCDAWESTSEVRDSVRDKRMLLWTLRRDLKLISILKGQMKHLDEWTTMDTDHSNSLLGAMAALKATTLRLPVIDGARADVQNVKEAISSAVDVMQAMTSSVCPLLAKVDETNSLVGELSNMAAKEQGHLDECRSLLSRLAVMQVKDCSLRTHIVQLSGISSSSMASMTTETH